MALEGPQASRARVFQEEIFGPVLVVVPFEDEAEGIALANATVYGLTAGVFTRSPARARRVAEALRAGNVYVNREITGARVGIEPFGGVWLSGTGPKAGGPEYLSAFVTRARPPRPAPWSGDPARAIGEGDREGAEASRGRPGAPGPLPAPWAADVLTRAERLAGAAVALADPALRLRALTLVARVPELALDEPGLQVPGQDTVTTWTTPRGGGLVVVDEGASGETWWPSSSAPCWPATGWPWPSPRGSGPWRCAWSPSCTRRASRRPRCAWWTPDRRGRRTGTGCGGR